MLFVIANSLDSSWDITDYQLFLLIFTSCLSELFLLMLFFLVIHRNRISFIIFFLLNFHWYVLLFYVFTTWRLHGNWIFFFTSISHLRELRWLTAILHSLYRIEIFRFFLCFLRFFLLWLCILRNEYGNIVRDRWDMNFYYVLFCLFFSGF